MKFLKDYIVYVVGAIAPSTGDLTTETEARISADNALSTRVSALELHAYERLYKSTDASFATFSSGGFIVHQTSLPDVTPEPNDAVRFTDGSIYGLREGGTYTTSTDWVEVRATDGTYTTPADVSALISATTPTVTSRVVSGTTDTILQADIGNIVTYNSASPVTVTVPSNLTKVGVVSWAQHGAGQVTFVGAVYPSGVGLTGKSFGQDATGSLTYVANNTAAKLSGFIA